MKTIYFDHAATTPVHKEVIKKMMQVLENTFGNPSSIHSEGRQARLRIEQAREQIAKVIGANPSEILFTSGGTEADNIALFGAAYSMREKGNHIITTKIEHSAIIESVKELEHNEFNVTYLSVDENGIIDMDELKNALTDSTILVSIMYANNEVGTIQPIKEIADILKDHQALFHTDAVQAFGVESINVVDLGVDLLSTSSHKINGPKGTGFLYVKDGVQLKPRQVGGSHEKKRRAGTENIAGIVGMAYAVQLFNSHLEEKRNYLLELKQLFLSELDQYNVNYSVNGTLDQSVPHVLNLYFPEKKVEQMLVQLDLAGICVSGGSACSAGSIKPSPVLVAMHGEGHPRTTHSIRFSFGMTSTKEEVKEVTSIINDILNKRK